MKYRKPMSAHIDKPAGKVSQNIVSVEPTQYLPQTVLVSSIASMVSSIVISYSLKGGSSATALAAFQIELLLPPLLLPNCISA